METIMIHGSEVQAVTSGSKKDNMPLADLLAQVAPRRMDGCGVLFPAGVRTVIPGGRAMIWIYESPPRVYSFRWITNDSPVKFGNGTKYRTVQIALPYLVVLAVFAPGEGGRLTLSSANECFFRVAPLKNLEKDELLFPALLNCSKFNPQEGHPLSWICTQHLNRASFDHESDTNRRLCAGFESLRKCLVETGFNYSSENHESSSWFTESRGIDPRISTVENWQAASKENPLFVLDVPWLKTGHTIERVAERIFKNLRIPQVTYTSAADLARVIFNQNKPNQTLPATSI